MDSAGSSSMPSVSANQKSRQFSVDEDDENVMIAVRALDDMRSRAVQSGRDFRIATSPRTTPSLSSSTSPSASITSQSFGSDDVPPESPDFVSRVSGIPLVNSAIRAYEHGKASSRVVKYGAEIMESSVRTISRPVMDRLPVSQLDEFACRQLDRFGVPSRNMLEGFYEQNGVQINMRGKDVLSGQFTAGSGEGSSICNESLHATASNVEGVNTDAASRSRWQALILEAGGIGAAMSGESMRRLSYCLQWLQYATRRIDGQILVLRNCITSISAQQNSAAGETSASASHIQTLADVKKDVVDTIRQVVDIVSKYAGGALPEPARSHVRQFILHLPQRWVNSTQHSPAQSPAITPNRKRRGIDLMELTHNGQPGSSQAHSPTVTAASHMRTDANLNKISGASMVSERRPSAHAAQQAAQKVLTLATESLDMMRNVTGIVKDSLGRAEAWIERLRAVGIERQMGNVVPQGNTGSNLRDPTDARPLGEEQFISRNLILTPRTSSPITPTTTDLSLSALSIASNYTTPLSRVSSLPSLASFEFDYSRKRPRSSSSSSTDEEGFHRAEERLGVSAIRDVPKMSEN